MVQTTWNPKTALVVTKTSLVVMSTPGGVETAVNGVDFARLPVTGVTFRVVTR